MRTVWPVRKVQQGPHDLSDRPVRVLLAGGLINEFRARRSGSHERETAATPP
jgi:hypothetical protein